MESFISADQLSKKQELNNRGNKSEYFLPEDVTVDNLYGMQFYPARFNHCLKILRDLQDNISKEKAIDTKLLSGKWVVYGNRSVVKEINKTIFRTKEDKKYNKRIDKVLLRRIENPEIIVGPFFDTKQVKQALDNYFQIYSQISSKLGKTGKLTAIFIPEILNYYSNNAHFTKFYIYKKSVQF